MPKTFEQAQEEEQKKRNEEKRERGADLDEFEMLSEIEFDGEALDELVERFDRIALPTPRDLKPGQLAGNRRRQELRINLLGNLASELGISLSELQERLAEQQDINLDVDDIGTLLQIIASLLQTQNQLIGVVANTSVSQLESMIEIARNTRPGTLVSASGRVIIEEADTPETIIPNADKSAVPTKVLYVRADSTNDNPIAIGDDEVDPQDGYLLKPGEAMTFEIDFRDEQLWMAAEEAGEAMRILGLF